jgi:hypothetical protein
MSASIEDILDPGGPQPRNIRLYLRMHGWEREGSASDQPGIWRLPTDDGTYEVLAPSSRGTGDFKDRVSELLRTVSIVEDRSPAEILRDLATQAFDVQYIRTEYGGPPGTAPLRDTADAYSAVQGIVAAAATSLDDPRPVLPPQRPGPTANLLRRVLAGPTGEGSYIISVWTPIPPRLTPDEDAVLFEMDDEPYERRVTTHLHTALVSARDAVRDVLNDSGGVERFVELAPAGVSANLCESLVALSGQNNAPFDVQFAWALDRPIPVSEPSIRFESETLPILSEAARVIRSLLPQEVQMRGQVVRLHREGNLGSGEVTISGVAISDTIERPRRVLVSLSEPDYQLAIRAHREYIDVDITGILVERGTRARLEQAHGFFLVPEPLDS